MEAVCRPKSGYPSADAPQLGLECRFLVATATRIEIQSQKGFSTAYHRRKYVRRRQKQWRVTLSDEKTETDSCALHKMLLVVFLHHRALLSLPQSSYSTNTSSSTAVCVSATRSVPPWLVLRSIAHVSCFQSRLRMSILSMI